MIITLSGQPSTLNAGNSSHDSGKGHAGSASQALDDPGRGRTARGLAASGRHDRGQGRGRERGREQGREQAYVADECHAPYARVPCPLFAPPWVDEATWEVAAPEPLTRQVPPRPPPPIRLRESSRD